MKTTVDLPSALLDDARRVAREDGTTLRALIVDGLRTELAARATAGPTVEPVEPVFSGDVGVQPGIDLGDWQELRAIAYGRWAG